MADLIRRIKSETPLAITLSLGERPDEDLAVWRAAGTDRYLLKFETSNRTLYEAIHAPYMGHTSDRIAMLRKLKSLGYQTGSGIMIGIPGQTLEDLADDIELFRMLDLDMIGVGPYIPHPKTPLGKVAANASFGNPAQVRNDELTACKVVALTRILCPHANIPATTALATIDRTSGFELALSRGANVIMPNLTPHRYRRLYEIYPGKVFAYDNADDYDRTLKRRIAAIGRNVGKGKGDTIRVNVNNGKSVSGRKL
jgi:biotin synthase